MANQAKDPVVQPILALLQRAFRVGGRYLLMKLCGACGVEGRMGVGGVLGRLLGIGGGGGLK